RIVRPGRDLSIVTYAAMVHVALEAAEELTADGAEVEVVDLRSLVPFDEETVLTSVARTGKVIVLHEAPRTGGFGAEIAATIAEKAFEYLEAPIVRVTAPDTPVPYSPPLEDHYLPGKSDVLEITRRLLDY
ncbi:MAG: transketolase C-terminal domain-containing protein, partial [Gemmatimonadota bacterium]